MAIMITEESFIDFRCPYCGETVSFPQTDVGYARACPTCTETVVVPLDGSETGGRLPLPLTARRLTLRRFAPGDWRDLLEVVSDEEMFRYTGGAPMQEEDVLRWMEMERQVKLTTPDQTFFLGIELKEAGKLIGYMSLRFSDPLQASLQTMVNRTYQKQGYGAEAVDALLGFCFQGIKLHRVSAHCESRNTAAVKLLEHVGFRREGEFIKDTPSPEGWLNSLWYAALAEEYSEPGS